MLYLRYQKFSHRCMLGVGGSNYVHLRDMYKYLLFHLISAPPRLRTDLSLLPLKNSIKKCYPLKTSLRNGFTPEEFHKKSIYPWRIPWNLCLPLKNSTYNMGFTPKEFPSFWPLPLKNSTTFIPYPWRIPLFLNREGGGGVRILNGIAHILLELLKVRKLNYIFLAYNGKFLIQGPFIYCLKEIQN